MSEPKSHIYGWIAKKDADRIYHLQHPDYDENSDWNIRGSFRNSLWSHTAHEKQRLSDYEFLLTYLQNVTYSIPVRINYKKMLLYTSKAISFFRTNRPVNVNVIYLPLLSSLFFLINVFTSEQIFLMLEIIAS